MKILHYLAQISFEFRNDCRSQKLSSRSDAVRCLENLRERYEPLVSYSLLASVRHKVLHIPFPHPTRVVLILCARKKSNLSKVLCGAITADQSVPVAEDDSAWLLVTADIPKKELICSVQIKSSIT